MDAGVTYLLGTLRLDRGSVCGKILATVDYLTPYLAIRSFKSPPVMACNLPLLLRN